MPLDDVIAGFPTSLFLTLAGVTLLFTQAQCNGTLDKLAHHAVRICRGNAGLIPMMFFVLGRALASIGPGQHRDRRRCSRRWRWPSPARAGIPAFLMAIMVGNGAHVGLAVAVRADRHHRQRHHGPASGCRATNGAPYLNNLVAHAFVAFGGYFAFGGWRLFRLSYVGRPEDEQAPRQTQLRSRKLDHARRHRCAADRRSVLPRQRRHGRLCRRGAARPGSARPTTRRRFSRMPWAVIMMVSGVTVLIAMLEKTQGLDLFTDLLARLRDARDGHRRHRVRHRDRFRLQQHVRRRAARRSCRRFPGWSSASAAAIRSRSPRR